MLSLADTFNACLSVLDVEHPASAPDALRYFVIGQINARVQYMQAAGPDYCTRTKINLNTVAGTASYALSSTLQSVLKPVRIGGKVAMELLSRGDLDRFGPIYCGNLGAMANALPWAFYLERLRSSTSDSASVNLWLAPTPDAVYPIEIEGVNEPVHYVVDDLAKTGDQTVYVPISHQYVESIFLPLCRMAMTESPYFVRTELIAQLLTASDRAEEMIETANPQTRSGPDLMERKKAAPRQAYNSTQ